MIFQSRAVASVPQTEAKIYLDELRVRVIESTSNAGRILVSCKTIQLHVS